MRHLPTYSLSKLFSLIAGVVAEAPFMLTEDLTEEEIAAGYIPAKIMSSKHWAGRAAVANGRGVADGSVVAALESVGE